MPVSVQFSINGRKIHRGTGYVFYNVFRPAPGRRIVLDAGNPPTVTDPTDPAAWAATTAYTLGQLVKGANEYIQRCITAGTSGASEPTWGSVIGGTTTDATVTWQNIGYFPGITRTNSQPYLEDDQIRDTNNNIQHCIVPGTSAGSAPTFSTALHEITLDGTVQWMNLGPTLGMGAREGAVEINAEGTTEAVEADEEFSPLRRVLTAQKVDLSATFKQLDVNLIARGHPDVAYQTGTDAALPSGAQAFAELTSGGLSVIPTPCLAVVAPKGDYSNPYKNYVFELYKGAAEGAPGLGFTRTKESSWKGKWSGHAVLTRLNKDRLWKFWEQT